MPVPVVAGFLRETVSTLKFKIVALSVLTGLLAAMGAVQIAMDATIPDIERTVLEGEKGDAERQAALLGDKLATLQAALRAVQRAAPPALWQDAGAMTHYLVDKPALAALFDVVAAVDRQGEQLARLERGVSKGRLKNLSKEEAFVRAAATDQPIVSQPLVSPLLHAPVVALLQPSVDGQGRHHGVLIGSLRLESNELFSIAGRHRNPGVHDIVVDRRGVILSHPDPKQIMQSAELLDEVKEVIAAWRDDGAPIDHEAVGRRMNGRFVVLAGIPGSDWALVRTTDEALALQPVDTARRRGWQIASVAGVMSGVLAGILAWFASLPIARLQASVERLRRHPELAADWPADSGEIGRLAQAFAGLVAERALKDVEARERLQQLHAVMHYARVGIGLTQDKHFLLANAEMASIFGSTPEQMVGQSMRLLCASDDMFEQTCGAVRSSLARDGAYEGELELVRANGEPVWCRVRGREVDAVDAGAGVIWTFEDVTAERLRQQALSWAASHDALTGLCNRAAFDAALAAACGRGGDARFALLFIDLDRFKAVNDTAGHAAGDAVLRAIAALLASAVRHSDVVARLGGDEFAVLLSSCPQARAIRVGETIRRAVERYELRWQGEARLSVGASLGLVAIEGGHAQPEALMRRADEACYAAKRAGRNRLAVAELGGDLATAPKVL